MVLSENRKSELYNTLAQMGLLCTENARIQQVRQLEDELYTDLGLSFSDIERIGYYNPHFDLPITYRGKEELWYGDTYINPEQVTWVETDFYAYGVMPEKVDTEIPVHCFYNPCIVHRYSKVFNDDNDHYYVVLIDVNQIQYQNVRDIERAAYYISENKVQIPETEWVDEHTIKFRVVYKHNIDFFICTNVVNVVYAEANVGTYIDQPHSNMCYHKIVIDNDRSYPIDARFYPCIKVDKDCTVRVFNTSCNMVMFPDVCRLVLYPEFADIDDPYICDNEILNSLEDVDEIIDPNDSEEEILRKYAMIAKWFYRLWEKFPYSSNEQSDFVVCDNSGLRGKTFEVRKVYLKDEATTKICSIVPFEENRDVLFYRGEMFSDYIVRPLQFTYDKRWIESPSGEPTYLIDPSYDSDGFTVIKFNTAEDTIIMNIGDYIDRENVARLHYKVNRFFRNLMVLRQQILDQLSDEEVRIMTTPPTARDEHLWFELLVNAIPEMFAGDAIKEINLYGLDPKNIPEDIKEGAYKLDMEPGDGPSSYTDVLMTYFKLLKAHKKYLVLQYGDGIDDPTVSVYNSMDYGKLPDDPKLNDVRIENQNAPSDSPKAEGYGYGSEKHPKTGEPGELYGQLIGGTNWDPSLGEINELLDDLIRDDEKPVEADDNDMFKSINDAVDTGIAPSEVTDPRENLIALEPISFYHEQSGTEITIAQVRAMTQNEKLKIIHDYLNDEIPGAAWDKYLRSTDNDTLTLVVYRILLMHYIFNHARISVISAEAGGTSAEIARRNNLRYIFSLWAPDDINTGDLWFDIPGLTEEDYIPDIISKCLLECGYDLPEGYKDERYATMVLDYGAHDKGTDGVGELFQEVTDETLHKIHYGRTPPNIDDLENNDIWYEFIDSIDGRVCYSNENTMIIRVDERLISVEFDKEDITAYAFDDILMNFKGKLGIRYMSILADLINSGVIKLREVNIFYKRLITAGDFLDPGLRRLYTGHSHVITTAELDTTDYAVMYSSNIGRFQMDYSSPDMTNREREAAYRMVIDYTKRDFAFLDGRMIIFVNGKYIPRSDYREYAIGKIQLLNFHEIIATVDILYSKHDKMLMDVKRLAIPVWPIKDESTSIQRPDTYGTMEPIHVHDQTYRGYYDVLLYEYIFSGKLMRILRYLEDHQEEAPEFILDMVRKFHAISDVDLSGMVDKDARIVIPANATDKTVVYQIDGAMTEN